MRMNSKCDRVKGEHQDTFIINVFLWSRGWPSSNMVVMTQYIDGTLLQVIMFDPDEKFAQDQLLTLIEV